MSMLQTLLTFLDRANTPPGRRLIRKWVAEPLVSAKDIEDRMLAVEDLHWLANKDEFTLKALLRQLKTERDLERALPNSIKRQLPNVEQ